MALAQLGIHGPARAQSLDELIPDEAVENTKIWAGQGTTADAESYEPPVEESEAIIDAESQVRVPDIAFPRIDAEEFEQVQLLEPQESFEFTDFGLSDLSPAVELETARIADGLELGLPPDRARFPEREEFLAHFTALSTVHELHSSNGNVAQLAARVTDDEALLRELLRLYGYYDGTVTNAIAVVNGSSSNGAAAARVRFDIQPSRQYLIGEVDLGPLAEAGSDFALLRGAFGIKPGDPVRSDRISAGRKDLANALGQNGYPFAMVDEPRLTVDHERFEADLAMPASPNGKYRIGKVHSGMPELLSPRHLSSLALFDLGDIYDEGEIQDLRQIVLETGLASRVSITPREVAAPGPEEPGTVDIDVAMDPAPLRSITAGIGYGTGEGFRISGSWEHRNFFPPEGMLRVRSLLGTREALAGVTFQRNNLGGRHRVLTLDTSLGKEKRDAYNARTATLLANYELKSTPLHRYRLTWGVGAELTASDERESKATGEQTVRRTFLVGALPLHGLLDTSDDLLDPTGGARLGLRLSPEFSLRGDDVATYLKARVDGSLYRRLGDGPVLAGRVALGSIVGAGTADIAPSRRFYSGGGGSVRGYSYEEIGPTDSLNRPNGGRSLVEFSLEARIPTSMFDGALSIVPFFDGGTVSRETFPTFDNVRFGAGLGVRYETAIGPIRVDVATPINKRPQDNRIAVYVSLGQAF